MNNQPDRDNEIAELLKQDTPPSLSSEFYDTLADNLEAEPTPSSKNHTKRRRVWATGGAASAAAAVAAIILITGQQAVNQVPQVATPTTVAPETSTTAPPAEIPFTLVSQVVDAARAKYAQVQTLSGKVIETSPCADSGCKVNTTTTEFRYRASGETWRRVTRASDDQAPYSVTVSNDSDKTGQSLQLDESSRYSTVASQVINAPLVNQSIVWGASTPSQLLSGLSIDDSSLKEGTVKGRSVWIIEASGNANAYGGTAPDRIVAQFDKETLLPVQVTEYQNKKQIKELKYLDLKVNPSLNDASFFVTNKKPDPAYGGDGGWLRSAPNAVPKSFGYSPLLPSIVPDGFQRTATASKKRPLNDDGASVGRNVVVSNYRNGLQAFTFETSSGSVAAEDRGPNARNSSVVIQGGYFDGATATVSIGFKLTPTLTVEKSGLTLVVSGDLSVDNLKMVAQSAQPV